jgi:hypothetical protein
MNSDLRFICVNLRLILFSASIGDSDEGNYPQILAEPRLIPAEYFSAAEIGSPSSL